ncbi:MAG: hypothetical protein LUG50_13350 [Planctomycetaceae bacterium]|nr:hypothetical protein [Planctomycetaceae bacterium]
MMVMVTLRLLIMMGLLIMASACLAVAGEGKSDFTVSLYPVEAFIAKWEHSGGSELGSSQSFLNELCDLLLVDRPHPPRAKNRDNRYTFEKKVTFVNPNGKVSRGRIDLYKRGCFVLESKQGSANFPAIDRGPDFSRGTAIRYTNAWDEARINARLQAERYVNALPPEDGRPPFIMVVDVGECIEVYSDFGQAGVYTPFPFPQNHCILLEDLKEPDIQDRLHRIWTDPMSLNPAIATERATQDIAEILARLTASLEESGYRAETISKFLMRAIFSMYAEDVELIPKDSFTLLVAKLRDAAIGSNTDDTTMLSTIELTELWKVMNKGGTFPSIKGQIRRFGGPLFAEDAIALPLTAGQCEMLFEAAKAEWSLVGPPFLALWSKEHFPPSSAIKWGLITLHPLLWSVWWYPVLLNRCGSNGM